ncbi:helix-turn-helix domain-containing protein [Cardiobacterium sp. AH-315-I02]|nr:helix-turn-helix domain-containing protein [Cardiobacterium sp. AH-315-I02]
MDTNTQPKKANLNEDWHPADIVAGVRKAGTTLRKLSFNSGYSVHTVKSAIQRPYPKMERIIADCIGVKPEDIWPSRYDHRRPLRGIGGAPSHKRNRAVNKSTNNNSLKKAINVKDGAAE